MRQKKEKEKFSIVYLILKIISENFFVLKDCSQCKDLTQTMVSRAINNLHYIQQNFTSVSPIFQGIM